MNNVTPPRLLHQDVRFEVTHLRGACIDTLIGVVAYDRDLEPSLIFLRPRDGFWQRFHLDAGFAVWEQCEASRVDDDLADDSYRHVDLADVFRLRGAEIHDITCAPARPSDNPQISIRLSSGLLVLRPIEPHQLDSRSVVSFSPLPADT